MLSFPTDAVVSKPASQITTELIGPTQPSLAPAGGLGIEGITIRPELDHRENDLETRDCACTDATHKHLQSPEEHNYDLGTTPTVVQDGILTLVAYLMMKSTKAVQISPEFRTDSQAVTANISHCQSCQLHFPLHTL
jgi:hypothetical protein